MECIDTDAPLIRTPGEFRRVGDLFEIWRDGKCRALISPSVLQAYVENAALALEEFYLSKREPMPFCVGCERNQH
jgi:hypothetical protein